MINLSRIQLELEKAKEGLREVEETIQKVEGKTFPNGPGRYGNLKVQLHSDKSRNLPGNDDNKLQRKTIASNIEQRNRRISSDDLSFNLKRGPRDKRDAGVKRQGFDGRTQTISARLTGNIQPIDDDDEDDDDEEFTKKLTLPSRVITTAAEAPSRQEIIAAQAGDETIKQRNRRMFGALVGTLQKFCKEETKVREREEKRLKVEKKLEEDAKREKEKLLQEKRELFLERKRREIEIKRIEWSLNRVKEYEAWESNVLPLKNFIQTHAKPHIFYLPSTHNSKTEERLAQSQKTVERMIEKRKNNLKEEIENSEKKARRTVVEEEEEEEAENIPQNSDSVQKSEPTVDIDFDAVNKENGFHPEDSKQEEIQKSDKQEEDEDENGNGNDNRDGDGDGNPDEDRKEEGTWNDKEIEEGERDSSGSDSENKVKSAAEEPQTEDKNVANNVCDEGTPSRGNNNEGDSDGGGEDTKDCEATGEGRTFDEDAKNNEQGKSFDNITNESDSDIHKVPVSESENAGKLSDERETTQMECEATVKDKTDDGKKEEDSSECDKKEDDAKKVDDTKKVSERRKEDSPKKSKRSYRSPDRRSRSPRRFPRTRRRSRSSSRRRKSYRRRSESRSKSPSPSKKSRRSPRSRRRSERASPPSKRRNSRSRRKSSSKSSRSASPKKRMKFRSPSSSSSRSDSD